jgi:hypothetical protein
MLPGLRSCGSLYKYQLEGQCDEFQVIALDPRGHGESDNQSAATTTTRWAKDLDGFLRALDLIEVTILGHSTFQGPDANGFSKGFSDQFLTDDAEESAKEAFYREGPYMAKLFCWAALVIRGMPMRWSKCPPWSLVTRVSKVPVNGLFLRRFLRLNSSSVYSGRRESLRIPSTFSIRMYKHPALSHKKP